MKYDKLRPGSKRWRKAHRSRYRRLKKKALRLIRRTVRSEEEAERFNRVILWLNQRVRLRSDPKRREGYGVIDGAIECPKCHSMVNTVADPCEWERNAKIPWRRGRELTHCVTDYWGGAAECCGLLLAFQPDGRAEAYKL
jgi:hypothetical protein